MTTPDRTQLLRHTVATLAYRAEKVLRAFPLDVVETRVSPGTRTPLELLSHLGDLMRWAEGLARGENRWQAVPAPSWAEASERFYRGLSALDSAIAAASPDEARVQQVFQGPIADALTHVGQLAMLRGMLGCPVRPESYARAEIRVGVVGRDQAAALKEFDGDASFPPREGGRAASR